jgi:hypothetical protein
MRTASATPRCHPHTARVGMSASMPATAPTNAYSHSLWPAPQNPALIPLGAPTSVGVGRRSPLSGADLASAGSAPCSPSDLTLAGVREVWTVGWAARCGGRTRETQRTGGLPPKRLNLSKSNLTEEVGRGLCRGALVSQRLELFRSIRMDSTFVLTGPGRSETGTALVMLSTLSERSTGAEVGKRKSNRTMDGAWGGRSMFAPRIHGSTAMACGV